MIYVTLAFKSLTSSFISLIGNFFVVDAALLVTLVRFPAILATLVRFPAVLVTLARFPAVPVPLVRDLAVVVVVVAPFTEAAILVGLDVGGDFLLGLLPLARIEVREVGLGK